MKLFDFAKRKLPAWQELRTLLRFVQQRLKQTRLKQVAGNLTFTSILSLVPLLAIALALFTMFPQFGTMQEMLQAYFEQAMMPEHISEKVLGYLTIFASKASNMSIFGIAGMLMSSIAMVKMIETAFNQIWQVKQQRPFIPRHALLLVIAILGPFLLGVSMTLTSYVYVAYSGKLAMPGFVSSAISWLLSILWTTGVFALLYLILPNRKIRWREALCGGLFAAIAFEISKRAFALFVIHSTSYNLIYGAVAAVPLFLLWIYLFWMITLSGAVLTTTLHVLWYERWRHIPKPGGAFLDAIEILRALYQAEKQDGASSMTEAELHTATGLGLDEVAGILETLQAAGWVDLIQSEQKKLRLEKILPKRVHHWHLSVDPEALTLLQIYQLLVFTPEPESPLSRQIADATEQNLQQTIATCFEEDRD